MFLAVNFSCLLQHQDYLEDELSQVRHIKSLLTQYSQELSVCGNDPELYEQFQKQVAFMERAETRILHRRDTLIRAEQLLRQSRDELAKTMDDTDRSLHRIVQF